MPLQMMLRKLEHEQNTIIVRALRIFYIYRPINIPGRFRDDNDDIFTGKAFTLFIFSDYQFICRPLLSEFVGIIFSISCICL